MSLPSTVLFNCSSFQATRYIRRRGKYILCSKFLTTSLLSIWPNTSKSPISIFSLLCRLLKPPGIPTGHTIYFSLHYINSNPQHSILLRASSPVFLHHRRLIPSLDVAPLCSLDVPNLVDSDRAKSSNSLTRFSVVTHIQSLLSFRTF